MLRAVLPLFSSFFAPLLLPLLLPLFLLLFAPFFALPASGALLATAAGTENTDAPPDDPGWDSVGLRSLLSAVYLGNRWVLTANHVGFGDVEFGGLLYTAVPNSKVRIKNPDQTNVDLQMFKITPEPPLPTLEIGTTTLALDSPVTLIGHGRNRGAATSYLGLGGWAWGPGHTMRWGENLVADTSELVFNTQSFSTSFDEIGAGGVSNEGHAVTGDSGGAVFQKVAGTWTLVGTLFAQETYANQPASTTIYGNQSFAVDLSFYREQIVALLNAPVCSDGIDDDGDGLIDHPADPGCRGPEDPSEEFDCEDGIDNDGDGRTDYPADKSCESASGRREDLVPVPALGPLALAGLTGMLLFAGRRQAKPH